MNAVENVFFSIRSEEPERPTITYQAMEELIAQERWMKSPRRRGGAKARGGFEGLARG